MQSGGRSEAGEIAATFVAHGGAAAHDEADAGDADGAAAGQGDDGGDAAGVEEVDLLAALGDRVHAEEDTPRRGREGADDGEPDAGAAHGVGARVDEEL